MDEGRLETSPCPVTQTSFTSTPSLPRVSPLSLAQRRAACSLHASPVKTPLLLLHGGSSHPLLCPEPPEAASRACLPLHESTCYAPPHEGMARTLGGGWEGTGDTWAVGPGPKWVAEQGWESGSQGMKGDSQSSWVGGIYLRHSRHSHCGWAQCGQGRSPTPFLHPKCLPKGQLICLREHPRIFWQTQRPLAIFRNSLNHPSHSCLSSPRPELARSSVWETPKKH